MDGRRQKSFALKSCEGYREPAHCQADSNWPIVPDWALRRCTTGFMLSHKLSVSQCSHLALAQRHCGCPRPSPGPAPPSVRVNCPLLRTDTFFFVRSWRRLRQSGPRPPRSSRARRAVLPGRRQRTHPPATSSPLLALAPRCTSAVSLCNPATAVSTVDSGACSIRSGARVQLGMHKGDHDMVHGLACMRGCSLVVQRVECGSNFKNRV